MKPLKPTQVEEALQLLYEVKQVLPRHYFEGSYNNNDVIEIDEKIAAFLDSLT